MEDTPTPAVNGPSQHVNAPSQHVNAPSQHVNAPSQHVNDPSQRPASQEEQAAQIHSGYLRAPESQFSPYIPDFPSEEQTLPSNSRRGTANSHFPASDIEISIAPSTKSNTLSGEKRIVFENAANMVRYHTWFVNPFVKPAEKDLLLEDYWVKAATKLGWKHVEMGRAAMTFVSLLIDKEHSMRV